MGGGGGGGEGEEDRGAITGPRSLLSLACSSARTFMHTSSHFSRESCIVLLYLHVSVCGFTSSFPGEFNVYRAPW